MDLSSLMAEDSVNKAIQLPPDEDILTVQKLANEQLTLEREFAEKSAELADLKVRLEKIREFDLPARLEALGLTSLTLLDKSRITISEEVYAGITEENRSRAFRWLEDTNNDGIIKNEVKCPFGKGQDAEAKELVDLLKEKGISFLNLRSVHPQTLKAFVRKRLEAGDPIPTDVFSIHVKKVASIELPKTK